jgi:hypothetical protein
VALGRAVKLGYPVANPAISVDLPRLAAGHLPVFSEEDIRTFLRGVAGEEGAACWLLAVTIGRWRRE